MRFTPKHEAGICSGWGGLSVPVLPLLLSPPPGLGHHGREGPGGRGDPLSANPPSQPESGVLGEFRRSHVA